MTGPETPEQKAWSQIDAVLGEAGWLVQNRDDANLAAGRGVAVREFKMAKGHGFADYLLFVDQQPVGAIEAKPAGHTLTGVEGQTSKYAQGLPPQLDAPIRPLPFLYQSTGIDAAAARGPGRRRRRRDREGFPSLHRLARFPRPSSVVAVDRGGTTVSTFG